VRESVVVTSGDESSGSSGLHRKDAALATTAEPLLPRIADLVSELVVRVEDLTAEVARLGVLVEEAPIDEGAGEIPRALGPKVDLLPVVVEQVEALTEQVAQLKRRIGVRATAPGTLTSADLERLATAVTEQLAATFEVVPDDTDPPASALADPAQSKRRRTSRRGREPLMGRDST
jgi:hypothetical protein